MKNPSNLFKIFFSIILITLLCSCGFHPRGDIALPAAFHTIYVKSPNPYGEFQVRLKKALRTTHINVVDMPDAAPITIQILKTSLISIPSSVGTSSEATVYTVTYNVEMNLLDSHGNALFPPRNLVATSTMIINAQQVLNSSNQLELFSVQLQEDVITQIFNILTSRQVAQLTHL